MDKDSVYCLERALEYDRAAHNIYQPPEVTREYARVAELYLTKACEYEERGS